MHFYESSIITTKDGLHCQVYGNEHPTDSIIVKPKYIPTDKVESDTLPYRFISSRKMNRLNLWTDKEKLKTYIKAFQAAYPQYVLKSENHPTRLLFSVPVDSIERIYFPRRGLKELMSMPESSLDDHLSLVYQFVQLLLKSGLELRDFGVTYSTLMGHYLSQISDINIVIYGKKNYWKVMEFLSSAKHPLLRWKSSKEWLVFYEQRKRQQFFSEKEFLYAMQKKRSEGYFGDTLFVIFGAAKASEVAHRWGSTYHEPLGQVTVQGTVVDCGSSIVRPGSYKVNTCSTLEGKPANISEIVFYSRDYGMIANVGEKVQACGELEYVQSKDPTNPSYYRVVVGYFDAYLCDRREQEYIKVILDE